MGISAPNSKPSKKIQRVLVWEEFESWKPVILRLLSDSIGENVFAELKSNPPRYFVSDKLKWLDDAICKVKGIAESDICTTLLQRLPGGFGFVRAFHGCRALSVHSYWKKGILPSNPNSLNRIARRIFSNKERVEDVIKNLATEEYGSSYRNHNEGKVFFCLQMEHLIEECGHYLLYGSEYLLSIANHIHEPEVLRRRGRATVIESNVPTKDIPPDFLYCLAGEILREIFERQSNDTYESEVLDFGFPIVAALSPENIVRLHHPTGIPNPHRYHIRED
jgi:hypothetical protein